MTRYLLFRFLQALLNLLFVATLVFALVRLTGDPVTLLVPDYASTAVIAHVRADLGLDQPLYDQYVHFLRNLAHFDLGTSWTTSEPVKDIIEQHFMATLMLSGVALGIAILIALPLGLLSAVYKGTPIDVFARIVALLGQSMPSFYFSIMLILIFAVGLRALPVAGQGGPRTYVLPGLALGWAAVAGVVRLTRSSMLDVLDADYIRMAHAKGLAPRTVIVKHALRNALIPVVTFVGLVISGFLGGAVVVESIFDWPGVGQMTLNAVQTRDYPVIQGAVLVVAACFIVINLIVDVLYVFLDPRIRFRE